MHSVLLRELATLTTGMIQEKDTIFDLDQGKMQISQ